MKGPPALANATVPFLGSRHCLKSVVMEDNAPSSKITSSDYYGINETLIFETTQDQEYWPNRKIEDFNSGINKSSDNVE